MKKYFPVIFLFAAVFCSSARLKAANTPPSFTGGHTRTLIVCENSSATSVNTLLTVADIDAGQTETWSLSIAAKHGTATVSYSTLATGTTLTPLGLTYMPTAGYTGKDTFEVIVSDGIATDITSVYVTVNPLPVAGTITGASSVCLGASVALTNTTAGGGWTVTNTTASVLGGLVTGNVVGVDTVKYTVINSCGIAVATHAVTINPLPNVSAIAGAGNVCVGASIILADGVSGGLWSASNTNAIVAGGTVTGMTAGLDTVSYTVTTVCGVAIATKVVTIDPLADAGVITGMANVCVGATVALTDIITGGVWSMHNGNATVAGEAVTGVTAGVDTVVYTVTTTCGMDTAAFSITIDPLPLVDVITTSDPTTICAGGTIALADVSAGGVWNVTTFNASVDAFGLVTGMVGGVDTIMYSITNICGTATAFFEVSVNPAPFAGFISGAPGVCLLSKDTLTNFVSGGTWVSSTPAKATISADGVVLGKGFGTTEIWYVVTNSCGVDTAKFPLSVDIPAQPIIDTGTSLCPLSALGLFELVPGGSWSSSSFTTAPVLGITAGGFEVGLVGGGFPGTATITYTLTNGCGTSSVSVDVTVRSAAECGFLTLNNNNTVANKEALEIFPNPNNGTFALNMSTKTNEAVQVIITNMVGQQVRSFATTTNNVNEIQLDVPSGVYFVTAATANKKYTAKVTIAN